MARRKRSSFLSRQAPLTAGRRIRRVLKWAGIVVGVLLLVCVGALLYLTSWLQSDGCRRYLERVLGKAAQAQSVSIPDNLRVSGSQITLPGCTFYRMGPVRELSVRMLHLDVDRPAVLKRILRLRRSSAEEMHIVASLPGGGEASAQAAPAAAPVRQAGSGRKAPRKAAAAPAQPKQSGSGFGFFKEISARAFDCAYTDATLLAGKYTYALRGFRLTAVPRPELGRGAWAMSAENARITTPHTWLRESGVKNATLFYLGDKVQLSEATVLLTPGQMNIAGEYRLSTGQWQGRIDLQQANVARILNPDWQKRLTGRLSGHLDIAGSAAGGSWQAAGKLTLKNGVLEGLPILSEFKIANTFPYRHITLEHASCTLTYPYSEPDHGLSDAWLWDDIDLRAQDGSLLVRGRIVIGRDGSLSGSLSVGLPAKVITQLGLDNTPFVSRIFNGTVHVPGYVWVQINLSGTIDNPQEDLSVRLSTVLPEVLPQMADDTVQMLHSVLDGFVPREVLPPLPGDSQQPRLPDIPGKDEVEGIINTGLRLIL